MDRKILIYDATCIEFSTVKGAARSGVYMVSFNLLKTLLESGRADIILYTCGCPSILRNALNQTELKDFNLSILNEYTGSGNGIVGLCNNIYNQYIRFRSLHREKRFLLWPVAIPAYGILKLFSRKCLQKSVEKSDAYFSPETKALPKAVLNHAEIEKHVVLHDLMPLIFPEYYPKKRPREQLRQLLAQMDQYTIYGWADSEYTRADFGKHIGKPAAERIRAMKLACSEWFEPVAEENILKNIRKKYHIPEGAEYIFSLCSLEPRKNLIRVIKTFIEFIHRHQIDNLYFVLGGGSWDIFVRKLEKTIGDLGDDRKYIVRAGYVSDEDLPALYSGAKWFVYTSQYEGFGLPPLEAMRCGCPVITSNNSSLPEVVGDAGIMIDWDDDEAHIEAYRRYCFDENLRQDMIQRGLERSGEFRWENTADKILDALYRSAK